MLGAPKSRAGRRVVSIPAAIIPLLNSLPADVREVGQSLLASRAAWSLALLKAIDTGTADKKLLLEIIANEKKWIAEKTGASDPLASIGAVRKSAINL